MLALYLVDYRVCMRDQRVTRQMLIMERETEESQP